MIKYIIRAIKYFIYFAVLFTIVTLVLLTIKGGNLNAVYPEGYNAILKIALLFAGVSAVYPFFGYTKKEIPVAGEFSDSAARLISFMESKGYIVVQQENETIVFQNKSFIFRLLRMFEDTIVVEKIFAGYSFEGARRDIIRLALTFRSLEEQENISTEE